jgi:hypothetical protein
VAGGKSEKEPWLNYKTQPFAQKVTGSIESVELLAEKDSHVFSL